MVWGAVGLFVSAEEDNWSAKYRYMKNKKSYLGIIGTFSSFLMFSLLKLEELLGRIYFDRQIWWAIEDTQKRKATVIPVELRVSAKRTTLVHCRGNWGKSEKRKTHLEGLQLGSLQSTKKEGEEE